LDVFQAIVLGIVQGLTEFLPISSSGHLRIVPAFFGWEDPGTAFVAVIQLGTMAAVVLYFFGDIVRITRAWLASLRDPARRSDPDARMGWYVIVGTVPIVVFGLALKDVIETDHPNLTLIATALIVLGLVLLAAEKSADHKRGLEDLSRRDAIVVGLAQALALVPGVSRSGATITAGLFLGFDRVAAARFSFLLSIPAVVLSGLFELRDVVSGTAEGAAGVGETAIATVLAFVVGYASIALLLRYLTSHTTGVFVAYRVALGTVLLVLLATNVIA
jgi:undecaprenyl-diphosphatase